MTDETVEAEAKLGGWCPQEEWKGDPGKWVDAQSFVERGKQMHGSLKDKNSDLEAKVDELKRNNDRILKATTEIVKMHETTKKKAVEEALAKFEEERLTAIEFGDKDEVIEIEKKIAQTKDEAETPVQKKQPNYDAWVQDNQWYLNNKRVAGQADVMGRQLLETGRYKHDDPDFYEAVSDMVKDKFPELFTNPNRDKPTVGRGSNNAGSSKSTSFEALTEEEKAAYYRFDDIYKGDGAKFMSKQEWAAKLREETNDA